jgi:hypothetical protein
MLESFGPYQLIERLEVGASTESFFAVGPGSSGARDPVRLTRVASFSEVAPSASSTARLQAALSLRAPFERTFHVGQIRGRSFQVREPAFGVCLRDLARMERGLPLPLAAWAALELCRAIEQWGTPAAIASLDERRLRIGWDGALFVHAVDLKALDAPPGRLWLQSPEEGRGQVPDARSAVFRICAVLVFMLTGRSAPPERLALKLPVEVGGLVDRNLNHDPAERDESVAALRAQLAPLAAPSDEAQAAMSNRVCSKFAQRHACDLGRLASVGLWTPEVPLEEPQDAAGWLVLSDLLQAKGDPRGELIALHAQRDRAEDPGEQARLEEEAQRLINRHGCLVPPVCPRAANFQWRHGHVRSLELIRTGTRYLLPMVLAHPSLRCLEELSFTTGGSGDAGHRVKDLCELRPKSLRVLKMPVLTAEHCATLRAAMPWLTRLELATVAEPPGFFRRLLRRLR